MLSEAIDWIKVLALQHPHGMAFHDWNHQPLDNGNGYEDDETYALRDADDDDDNNYSNLGPNAYGDVVAYQNEQGSIGPKNEVTPKVKSASAGV